MKRLFKKIKVGIKTINIITHDEPQMLLFQFYVDNKEENYCSLDFSIGSIKNFINNFENIIHMFSLDGHKELLTVKNQYKEEVIWYFRIDEINVLILVLTSKGNYILKSMLVDILKEYYND